MTTFVFFVCCILAAAAELCLFFMGANMKYPSLAKMAAIFAAMAAVAFGLWIAYQALPEPSGCASTVFIVLEAAVGIFLFIGFLQAYLGYILIVGIVVVLLRYVIPWLFANGIADGSIIGSLIAAAIVIVAVSLAFGAILQLKKKLTK